LPRPVKIAATAGCILVAVAAALAAYAWMALRQVQPFYAAAIEAPPQKLADDSREMESRVAALYSDATPAGQWHAVFTDDEVNGWLAVALAEKFPTLLPPEVSDPRVAFVDGKVLIGFHWRGQRLDAVVSVEAEAAMAEDEVLAVRLRGARAGSLPLPLADIVEQMSLGATQIECPLTWTHEDGDPVALLPTEDAFSTPELRRQLKNIEVRDGELLLSGATGPPRARQVAARSPGN
jgi:hypothetical protein